MADCCTGDDCGGRDPGCWHGGCIHCALEWLQTHATVFESDYPYEESHANSTDCRRTQYPPQATAKSVTILDENDTKQMKQGLVQVPMPIGVDSETDEFMFYKKGVFNFAGCGTDVDHAVLAVGYQEPYQRWVDGVIVKYPGYWIIKNSFGKTWGEAGYIRIQMGNDGEPGICGVQTDSQYALAN